MGSGGGLHLQIKWLDHSLHSPLEKGPQKKIIPYERTEAGDGKKNAGIWEVNILGRSEGNEW